MSKLLFLGTTLLSLGALGSFAFGATGCTIDDTNSPPRTQQTGVTPSPDPGPTPAPTPAADAGVDPLVVEVDPDRTMKAEGGQGVGVFVEYASGGKWHLFWTCDTALSGQSCEFLLRVTATTGTLTVQDKNVDPAASFEFESLTKTEVNETYFDAKAGSDVQIEAIIGGEHSSRFFFFVQNGAVNGDYTGILTDPLIFRPKGGK